MVVQQDLNSQSIFVLMVNILSNVGGIFASIDGVYAFIFGRTVLGIIIGESMSNLASFLSPPPPPFPLLASSRLQILTNHAPAQDLGPTPPLDSWVSWLAKNSGLLSTIRSKRRSTRGPSTRRAFTQIARWLTVVGTDRGTGLVYRVARLSASCLLRKRKSEMRKRSMDPKAIYVQALELTVFCPFVQDLISCSLCFSLIIAFALDLMRLISLYILHLLCPSCLLPSSL